MWCMWCMGCIVTSHLISHASYLTPYPNVTLPVVHFSVCVDAAERCGVAPLPPSLRYEVTDIRGGRERGEGWRVEGDNKVIWFFFFSSSFSLFFYDFRSTKLTTLSLSVVQKLFNLKPLQPTFVANVIGTLRIQAETENEQVKLPYRSNERY